ncbi:MAG: Ribonuclease BN [Candidatus Anoxychlamydiales bacterium]|nr:Ribonuclease BN [Candidatus Anoxychlamydiales bacterium]
MKLKFLGTRGYIKPKTKRHSLYTSLLIIHNKKKIMIDCGKSYIDKLDKIKPDAIVLTHGHIDHAYGLENGSNCKVYATKDTFENIKYFPIDKNLKRKVLFNKKFKINGIAFEAFEVEHSILCPAVGYRISFQRNSFFYVPDVLWIKDRKKAFKNISFYIGDGATIKRSFVRKDKKTNKLYGHANISSQLTWCKKENIKKMIITHLGSEIVKDEKKAKVKINELSIKKGVDTLIAYDGMTINFP